MSILETDGLITTDGKVEVKVADIDMADLSSAWDGIVLDETTVPKLSELPILGDNPEATLYPNGNIVGSSNEGSFTLYPNGNVKWEGSATAVNVTVTAGSIYKSASASPRLPVDMVSSTITNVMDSGSTLVWGVWNSANAILMCYASLSSRPLKAYGIGRWK